MCVYSEPKPKNHLHTSATFFFAFAASKLLSPLAAPTKVFRRLRDWRFAKKKNKYVISRQTRAHVCVCRRRERAEFLLMRPAK
jgi:hypothetical protein